MEALQKADWHPKERFIISQLTIRVETITLRLGDLATLGYILFIDEIPEAGMVPFHSSRVAYEKFERKESSHDMRPPSKYQDES